MVTQARFLLTPIVLDMHCHDDKVRQRVVNDAERDGDSAYHEYAINARSVAFVVHSGEKVNADDEGHDAERAD